MASPSRVALAARVCQPGCVDTDPRPFCVECGWQPQPVRLVRADESHFHSPLVVQPGPDHAADCSLFAPVINSVPLPGPSVF
jgi:hypothetical protein